MQYSLIRVANPSDRQLYHAIRRSSLWEERGRAGYDDARPEELLPNHHSLLLKLDGAGIGTTRLDDLGNGTGIVRLVAITAPLRRNGHGRVLDAMVADYARALGLDRLFVSAASDAEGFYSSMGWIRLTRDVPILLGQGEDFVPMTKHIVR